MSNNCKTAMKTLKNLFLKKGLGLLLFFAPAAFAQVTSTVDPASIKIGEEIKYTIQVEADSISGIVFPEGQTFLPLEVIEEYPVDTSFQQAKYRLIKKYGLTQFDSGRYVIPQQRILIDNRPFLTDSILIEVADVAVDTTTQKMFAIKSAIDVPPPPSKFLKNLLWTLLILAVLVGIAYLLVRRKRKIKESKKQLPPYEEALFALQSLDNSELLKNYKIKDYYSSLTEIVKRYLDREVDETALESTTNELIERLRLLKDSGKLDFDLETIANLDAILRRADLIKFAKMNTETGQAQADRSSIENIINKTHEAIPEPTEEELLRDEMYRQEQERKRKRRKQQTIVGIAAGVFVAALVITTFTLGFNTVRDAVFGNETKAWAEGNWIRSEYGNPAIVIETPEVLVRLDSAVMKSPIPLLTEADVFAMGDVRKKLFVLVNTIKLPEGAQLELENVLDEQLNLLERGGATNMIVKDEPFETEKGIKGVRASGEFNIRVGENKYKKDKSEYEILIFAQNNGLQELIIVYEKNDLYAQQIKERILRTVELEVAKK